MEYKLLNKHLRNSHFWPNKWLNNYKCQVRNRARHTLYGPRPCAQILNVLLNNGKLLGENLKKWHFQGKSINIIISRMEKWVKVRNRPYLSFMVINFNLVNLSNMYQVET